jgi:phage internal scaffolding protein
MKMEKKKMSKVMQHRLQTKLDASGEMLTDQSWVKNSDINNIMKKYAKTGVLPQTKQNLAQYLDVSEVPSLEDAHNLIIEARNMFMELPADVRKLMDNDPNNLHDFCKNPANREYLIERGVLDKVEIVNTEVSQVATISKPEISGEA